jgi:hypothetical protein
MLILNPFRQRHICSRSWTRFARVTSPHLATLVPHCPFPKSFITETTCAFFAFPFRSHIVSAPKFQGLTCATHEVKVEEDIYNTFRIDRSLFLLNTWCSNDIDCMGHLLANILWTFVATFVHAVHISEDRCCRTSLRLYSDKTYAVCGALHFIFWGIRGETWSWEQEQLCCWNYWSVGSAMFESERIFLSSVSCMKHCRLSPVAINYETVNIPGMRWKLFKEGSAPHETPADVRECRRTSCIESGFYS